MMGENFRYTRPNQIVEQLVREGLFGKPYYAEGEYIHELKARNEETPWRRRWQTGIDGVTYGTHSLGPVLQWMPGDRVVSVCCAGSGHNHVDTRGDLYESQASCVMLCKMASGGLVKIRVDMISDRPHSMMNYQLQGTDGCYESARAPGERDRVWLRSYDADAGAWMDLDELAKRFTPELWRDFGDAAEGAGHGGGDVLEIMDFARAVRGEADPTIGIHEAMDMTLPGLVSQRSVLEGGRWLDVPDSREW
jgi:predicted dehydrogenase